MAKMATKINPSKKVGEEKATVTVNTATATTSSEGEKNSIQPDETFFYFVDDDEGCDPWCIVTCCFLVNIVAMGFLKTLGILIIEVQKAFNASPSEVSILVSIVTTLNSLAGPFACYLVMRYAARTIAFFGTVLVSLGLILSWFATTIYFLYFSLGVLVGLGSGFTYSPGVILVGNYFQKNRGMANGIVVSGSPVGGMIMPFMLNFLVEYLDCRGALLILGGLMMNAVVCTLSYKPYKPPRKKKLFFAPSEAVLETKRTEGCMHLPVEEESKSSISSIFEDDYDDESSGPEYMIDELSSKSSISGISKRRSSVSEDPSSSVVVYKVNETQQGKRPRSTTGKTRPILSTTKPPFWNNLEVEDFSSESESKIVSKASQTEIRRKDGDDVTEHPFTNLVRRRRGILTYSTPRLDKTSSKSPAVDRRIDSTSTTGSQTMDIVSSTQTSLRRRPRMQNSHDQNSKDTSKRTLSPYVLSLDHTCVTLWSNDSLTKRGSTPQHSLVPPIRSSAGIGDGDDDKLPHEEGRGDQEQGTSKPFIVVQTKMPEKKDSRCTRFIRWLKNSPLAYPTFIILLLSNGTTAIATTNILLLIPSMGEQRELTKAEASTVYLIISVCDLFSRLFGSFIYDRKWLSPKTIFSLGLCAAGVSSFFLGYAEEFPEFCGFGGLFGLSCGLHIGIFGALLADTVGVALLPVGYAFTMILNGTLQFIFINVSGQILSADADAYTGLYVFYGITLLCGGSLWLYPLISMKVLEYRDKKKLKKTRKEKEQNEEAPAALVEPVKVNAASYKGINDTVISNISGF